MSFLKVNLRILLCASALLATVCVQAQESPDYSAEDQDIFDLPVFEVSVGDDRGYLATNSTSATSLDTEVRDLPMGIEVITTEFIEDVQAADMKEALAYSPGVFFNTRQNSTSANVSTSRDISPSSGVQASDFNDAVIIRGYTVPNQQRLGFRVGTIVPGYGVTLGGITDSANIQRQEVVRGPQSLLYGINVLSGIVNFMPKRPLPDVRTEFNVSVGDDGFFRSVLDHTGPLVRDKLNFRVMGSYLEEDYEIDFKSKYHEYYVAQMEWFIAKDLKLFVEGQYADTRVTGIGQQFFYDSSTGLRNSKFANKYDERFTFGRDYLNDLVFDDENLINSHAYEYLDLPFDGTQQYYVSSGDPYLVQNPRDGVDYGNAFVDLGPYYNVSGPDTYRERQEFDLTMILNYSPIKNLDLEGGIFYTEVDDKEFNVQMGTFNNAGNTLNPFSSFLDTQYNPEFDMTDPMGRGVGELFLSPDPRLDHQGNEAIDDMKYAYYMWYERPTNSETIQARFRAAYTLETDWFNKIKATHTFTGGYQFIEDQVSFVQSDWDLRKYYATVQAQSLTTGQVSRDPLDNRLAEDPVIYRKSVFDYNPIRYDPNLGELATVGYIRDAINNYDDDAYIKRSGWYDATLWYRGAYGVYHGRFFNDRLTLIAGIRQDAYQVKEQEQLRVMDPNQETGVFQGFGNHNAQTPYLIGYGDKPYEHLPELSDSMNESVAQYYATFQEQYPKGTTEFLFDDYTNFVTKTFGISFRLTDDLSTYVLYSEGIFPNTGLRDGAYEPFDAESTTSNEIGLKFEFFDRKISGRVSVWEINRENAVWNWPQAPSPSQWWGGPEPRGSSPGGASFNPDYVDAYRDGNNEMTVTQDYKPMTYGVAMDYIRLAYDTLGLEFPEKEVNRRGQIVLVLDPEEFKQYGGYNVSSFDLRDPEYELRVTDGVFVSYSDMMAADEATGGMNPLKLAMDMAVRDSEYLDMGGFPIYYYGTSGDDKSHSASAAVGANVGYEEEGVGVDGQIIFSPLDNWQIMLGYSYQKREVTDFNLVSGYRVDLDGNRGDGLYTTPYDVWVMLLGPDNFEDPSDPSTLKSGSIKGLDLSFVPRTNFNIWTKYSFVDGPLDRLEIGGGINYYGPTPTSISIGGEYMYENPYSTPDLPAHYSADLYLGYRFTMLGNDWRIALNIFNLLNETLDNEVVTYETPEGIEYRRSRVYYDDRSFRVSLSTKF